MYRIVLALFCGLLIVVENAVVEKRNNSDDCEEMWECLSPFYNETDLSIDPYGAISDNETLNMVCGQMENVEQCLRQEHSGCSDRETLEDVWGEIRLVNYFCSRKGRQVVSNFVQSGSECLGDQLKQSELKNKFDNCTDVFVLRLQGLTTEVSSSDARQLLSQLKSCMTGKTETLCGHDFRQLIDDVFEITKRDDFQELQCNRTEQNARHMMRRGIAFALSFNRKK